MSRKPDDNLLADLSIIEGKYLRDILDQPASLRETLRNLQPSDKLQGLAERLHRGEFTRVVLTGMGSSYHALNPCTLQLVDQGITALSAETSELIHYKSRFFDRQTLLVVVSQSGHSAEVIRLLDVNRKRAAVIAVTNTADSPLAKQADAALVTHAGQEFSVSCKTYVSGLMALRWLADFLCGREARTTTHELENAPDAVTAYLANWEAHVSALCQKLGDIRHLFLVGRGASLAAAGTGALTIKEADHFHAEGMSSAAFRHGPLEMLGEEIFVLVFSGDPKTSELNRRLLDDIREQKGRAELVGEDATFAPLRLPAGSAGIRPILEILPIQMITLALAAQAGREPGVFELARKVTTTE